MFVSSPTTSSLILKSIRQRLIEGTINAVNRSLCNYTRNQPNTFTAWLEEIVWPVSDRGATMTSNIAEVQLKKILSSFAVKR